MAGRRDLFKGCPHEEKQRGQTRLGGRDSPTKSISIMESCLASCLPPPPGLGTVLL